MARPGNSSPALASVRAGTRCSRCRDSLPGWRRRSRGTVPTGRPRQGPCRRRSPACRRSRRPCPRFGSPAPADLGRRRTEPKSRSATAWPSGPWKKKPVNDRANACGPADARARDCVHVVGGQGAVDGIVELFTRATGTGCPQRHEHGGNRRQHNSGGATSPHSHARP